MGIIDNYKFFAYSLFGFAAFVGVIKLFAPKNFSGIIKTITEILMFLVIASLFIKPQYFSINDIKEYKKKDYSDTYNLLQQEAINKELEGIVSEKLCEEGIRQQVEH